MIVHLTEDKLWKGTIYLAGECEIPEELAEICGLMPEPQPKPKEPSKEPKDVRKSTDKPSKGEGESGGN